MNKYFKTTSNKPEENKNGGPYAKSAKPCQYKDDKKALVNYTTWLNERHALHHKLGKKLCRQSGELLMNLADESNQVKEEKKALEYTRIPQQFDKYRGNPECWEFPPGLHDKCTYRRDEITHFYQKTEVQKNEIPEIEKVGLPGFIKNEKMLFPRTRNVYQQWQNSNYRKKRVEELSSLLKNIEPHKPDFDRLIVMGKNVENKQEETQTLTVASNSSSSIIETKRKTSVYDSSLKCCLKINGVYFYENSQSLSTSRKFHVLFEYDVQSLPLQTQYVVFENVGRVTIRLTWHKMEKFKLFRDITKTNNTEFFCFDKNLMILVPGQIVNFPIWFQTKKVCTIVETWEITTVPKFWPDAIRVFFVFQAQSHIENFMKRIRMIKSNINQRVKCRIIKEILEDLTLKTKYQSYKNTDYHYYEPELFEATNFDDSVPVRKPKYLYDKVIVEQLKKFYAEVRQPYHPKTWNLNVRNLQILARLKDLIEYAEIRTAEFSQYRVMMSSRTDVTGEKRSKSTLDFKISRSKMSSGLEIEEQSDLFTIKETRYAQLMKLLWKLAPPSITLNEERLKYFQIYSIFCAYFTLMSLELHTVRAFTMNQKEFKQTLPENIQRLIFEKFDDTQMIRSKRSFQEDMTAQPKPEKLSDISLTDVQKMHRLYFASPSSEYIFDKDKGKLEKNLKKKNKDDSRISKSKPSRLPSNLSRTTFEEMGLVNLDFDPYEEVLPVVSTKRQTSISEETEMNDEVWQKLSQIESSNIYITIYNYLSKAVDAMVDCLESAKEYRVPHENLEQLKACFKVFLEEEASPEEKQRPVNPFTNPEERDYFEKILGAHLNEVTGQYMICGKTEPVSKERHPVTFWSGEKEIAHLQEASSIFSLYERVPDKISFEEREAQTLPFVEPCENDTVSFSSQDIICECPPEFRHSPPPPCDMFYYSDDEVFEGQDISGKNVNSRVASGIREDSSEEGIMIKVPQKKPILSRQSLSLLKEWNKKQFSKQEADGIEEIKNE